MFGKFICHQFSVEAEYCCIIACCRERAGTVTGFACQMVCLLTVLLHPYMPQTSDTLKQQINLPEDSFVIPDKFLPYLPPGHKIGKVIISTAIN